MHPEIVAMRDKLHAAHPNRSGLFDLKHDRGGMIDIEFAVQYLVLAHAHRHVELTGNLGNIALLGLAAGLSLIGQDDATRCRQAYREFRHLQHGLRLNGSRYARVPREQVDAYLANAEIVPWTPHTDTNKAHIRSAIEEARTNGFAAAVEQTEPDAAGAAAAIYDHTGTVRAALVASGPSTRFDKNAIAAAMPHLLKNAAELSRQLGYNGQRKAATTA